MADFTIPLKIERIRKKLKCSSCGNSLKTTDVDPLGKHINPKTGRFVDRGTDYTFQCIKPRTGFWKWFKSENPCEFGIKYNDVEKAFGQLNFISTDEWLENRRCRG